MNPSTKGLDKFDYKNTNLNKLSDYELKMHKMKMDEDFSKKQLKPGDPGFEYDKRVKFDYADDELEDNSWDEADNDDEEIDSDEYEQATRGASENAAAVKSKTALEIAMEKAMEAANIDPDYDDEDYFDDDFA
jgi:hypothetical protein